ncbi:DMT family transporter [Ovoidimarina sediminis]|uniref:DMT family transporter n=1 Tax=Ovoidimarina sediminis TaxID=3079856 RepID=UPI0029158A32|nr:DMT family transporter [Rhodophyticola sp. MJ-SS7]MDU8942296.1 DMT family transporter [Rhodophyticola sp. MJ-SS7]
MSRETFGLFLVLVLLGAGWGSTMPLSKIVVSTGHQPLGLVFWQLFIAVLILGAITFFQGKTLPMGLAQIRMYTVIALLGTILPNSASYAAAVHLPAGLLSIIISLVPMFAFPIALVMGLERFSLRRFAGLMCGVGAVILIVGPEASLPERAMIAFIPLAMIAPFFYGLEGNVVARWGTAGVGPVRLLLGASVVGVILAAPLAVLSGHWVNPFAAPGAPEAALAASSVIHAVIYAVYVWLLGRAGAVFAAQVAYLVTGFGVVWAMVLLGERYSAWLWAALALMFVGLTLVQPKRPVPVETAPDRRDDRR